MTTERICGTCTMCCRTTGVPELHKPMNTWCQHCNIGRGCAIYGQHPESCKIFACVWRQGVGPDEMRPDHSKVVMFQPAAMSHVLVVQVTPEVPDAYKHGAVAKYIDHFLAYSPDHVAIVVNTGTGKTFGMGTNQQAVERVQAAARRMSVKL